MSPLISVCLPVFNGQKHLSAAIESVLEQSEPDFELIVSDDFSSDESWAIIQHYVGNDGRIKAWRNHANLGLFRNYNLCLSRASGTFIKTFAQDDLIERDTLKKTVAVLEEYPEVVLVTVARDLIDDANQAITDEARMLAFDHIFPAEQPVNGCDVIVRSLLPVTNFIGEPATATFRRSSLGSGFDTALYHLGDLDFWLRLLGSGNMFYLPERLCRFRLHDEARTSKNTKGLLFAVDQLRLGRKFASLLRSRGISYEDFLETNIEALAQHIDHLENRGEISLADLRSDDALIPRSSGDAGGEQRNEKRLLSDLMDFREIAFLSLRAAAKARKKAHDLAVRLFMTGAGHEDRGRDFRSSLDARRADETRDLRAALRNQRRIVRLELKLRTLLASDSWRLTRLLRDLNRHRTQSKALPELMALRQFEKFHSAADSVEVLNHQLAYIRYLRHQIAKVKTSRSWKLTRPLRFLRRAVLGPDPPVYAAPDVFPEDWKGGQQTAISALTAEPEPAENLAQAEAEKPEPAAFAYDLAVAAIFQNDAPYLKE